VTKVGDVLMCDVCNERASVGVAAVPGVPISCAYCAECLGKNAHPLYVVIGNTALVGGYEHAADWWQYMVDCTLGHLGKTREWFDAEVAESIRVMEEEERNMPPSDVVLPSDFFEDDGGNS
jgi:hypothetical protein